MIHTIIITGGPTKGACSVAVPAMSTRPMTNALRIRASGTPIIGRNTLGSCPGMALSYLKDRQYSYSSK